MTHQPESLKLELPVPLTQHPAAVYLASISDGSKPTMRNSLNTIASLLTNGECDALTLDWSKLRYQHTTAVRMALKERYAPTTVNKILAALRRVLKEALRLDLIDLQDYMRAADVPNINAGHTKPKGRALRKDEIADLMAICQDKQFIRPIDIRDAALFALLRGTGVRREELVNFDLKDLDLSTGALEVRHGKGNKYRLVYLPTAAIPLIEDWLKVRGDEPGPLLCPVHRWNQVQLRRMSVETVNSIAKKRADEAGVDSFSPHDLRRTFCSDLLNANVDIVTVQKLAGHASPTTTAKYDRRNEEVKRAAVQKLEF